MAKAFVKPVHSEEFGCLLKVRNPQTGTHVKNDGEYVELDTYFRRRIKDRSLDVLDGDEPKKFLDAKAKAETAAKPKAEADAKAAQESKAADSAGAKKG